MSLSAARLPPAEGKATHLVVLCHGYGADGNDLINLAQHWQALLPSVAFAAPHAPTRVPGSNGYQWFPISRIDPREMQKGVEAAEGTLNEFLDQELARLGLPPENLALVGFSQGTMLSLHVGLRRPVRPAAIIGFSGLLAAPPPQGPRPPILLVHGDADQVIPAPALFAAATMLGAAGAAVQWHLSSGVGHGIDPVGLALAGGFLQMAFAGRLRRGPGEIACVLR
ncbi:MAG TPA: phospholipase [Rhizomicrobium sp.]